MIYLAGQLWEPDVMKIRTKERPVLRTPHLLAPALVTVLACLLAVPLQAEPQPTSQAPLPEAILRLNDPNWSGRMIAAHRGDDKAGPDNSAEAIAAGAEVADTIELDLQTTKDGVFVCFHDYTLTLKNCLAPDPSWYGRRLNSLTADEMRRVRSPGPQGKSILTFAQALDVCRKHRACPQLDLKNESNATAEAVIRQAAVLGMDRHLIIQCQSPTTVAYIRKLHPQVATLARCRNEATVRLALGLKATIIQVDDEWASPLLIQQVRDSGPRLLVKVLGGRLDRPEIWKARYDKGYHLLLTDKPRELRSWLLAQPR